MSLSTFTAFKHIKPQEGMVVVEGEILRQLQSVLLAMLKDVVSVCDSNGIDYMLAGGTCLGAIRHQGFIPWDDDIDLSMSRSAYAEFAPLFLKTYGDKYTIQDPYNTPNYELGFPRIRLKGTVLRNRDDFCDDADVGVYIDIFLIENTPDNYLLRKMHGFGSLALGLALSCRRFALHRNDYLELAKGAPDISRLFRRKARIGLLFSFISATTWCRLWDRWNAMIDNEMSEYVTIPVGRNHYFGEEMPRSEVFPSSEACFEDMVVRVQHDADSYLTHLYGSDYMSEPPLEQREAHVVYELDLGCDSTL